MPSGTQPPFARSPTARSSTAGPLSRQHRGIGAMELHPRLPIAIQPAMGLGVPGVGFGRPPFFHDVASGLDH